MKLLLLPCLVLCLGGSVAAQSPSRTTFGREPLRGPLVAAPTAAEAEYAGPRPSRYLAPIEAWSVAGDSLTARFTRPFAWANRQIFLHMEAAVSEYEVAVNGRTVAYNADPNYPADFNLTKYAGEGANRLTVRFERPSAMAPLESWKESGPRTPDGRGAYIYSQPTMYIRDVAVRCRDVAGTPKAEIAVAVRTAALNDKTSRIHYDLRTADGARLTSGHADLTLGMRGEDTVHLFVSLPDTLLWSAGHPVRCDLRLSTQYMGRYVEYMRVPLGFRTVGMQGDTLLINGTPTPLRIREVRPAEASPELVGRLKAEGYDAARLTAGAVNGAFYEACDSLGLYVVAQIPVDTRLSGPDIRRGGNPSNDPAWLPAYIERTTDACHALGRHPSVIAISLAEKSANGINLYESYLHAKRLAGDLPVIYPDAAGEWNSDPIPATAAPVPPSARASVEQEENRPRKEARRDRTTRRERKAHTTE